MKLKFLFSMLVACALATVSYAQTNVSPSPFEVAISAENQTFFVNSGAWLVKVKITNRTNETLNLKDYRGVHFNFNKTNAVSAEQSALGFYGIDQRVIKSGESFEFEADLKMLSWLEPSNSSSYFPDNENRRSYQPILSGIYTVFASIIHCEEIPPDVNASRIEVRNCQSNRLAVKVAVKMDK